MRCYRQLCAWLAKRLDTSDRKREELEQRLTEAWSAGAAPTSAANGPSAAPGPASPASSKQVPVEKPAATPMTLRPRPRPVRHFEPPPTLARAQQVPGSRVKLTLQICCVVCRGGITHKEGASLRQGVPDGPSEPLPVLE